MGKKHFTEEQIAYALRQQEAGTPIAELTRKLGVSEQTFYRWKRKFAGLVVAELHGIRHHVKLRLKIALQAFRSGTRFAKHRSI